MPSGFTQAVLREEIMTCACVTMRACVHISVCGTQDRQDKTRQGVETTKSGRFYLGKVPLELRFEPRTVIVKITKQKIKEIGGDFP